MRRKWRWFLVVVVVLGIAAAWYVHTHPLVFMDTHQHCIKAAGNALSQYASGHEGRFPTHPRGYGNALLLLNEDCFNSLTGPGYSPAVLHEAKKAGKELSEEECGRVYIQGLTDKSNFRLVVLFDKLPTPGGDHCPLLMRLWRSLGREILFKDGTMSYVREDDWPEFSRKQVDLLVQEGFDRKEAERLYASKPRQ